MSACAGLQLIVEKSATGMTHDVLRSDIEIATRLRTAERPDHEIIAALVQRGVDPAGAAQLVDDLRNGRQASAKTPAPPELLLPRRTRLKNSESRMGSSDPQAVRGANPRSKQPMRPTHHHGKKNEISWHIPAMLVAFVVVVGCILLVHHYRARSASTDDHPPMPKVFAPGQHP
jgi:hypothetical protein